MGTPQLLEWLGKAFITRDGLLGDCCWTLLSVPTPPGALVLELSGCSNSILVMKMCWCCDHLAGLTHADELADLLGMGGQQLVREVLPAAIPALIAAQVQVHATAPSGSHSPAVDAHTCPCCASQCCVADCNGCLFKWLHTRWANPVQY